MSWRVRAGANVPFSVSLLDVNPGDFVCVVVVTFLIGTTWLLQIIHHKNEKQTHKIPLQ